MIGIYCIENIITGKRYIGKSVNPELRLSAHKSALKNPAYSRNTSRLLHASVQKYGFANFHFGVIERFPFDEIRLAERELYWIDFYNTCNREFGYNLLRESAGVTTHSDDTKALLSHLGKGRRQTPEHVAARTKALIGVKHSRERILARVSGTKGIKLTLEQIEIRTKHFKGTKQSQAQIEARTKSRLITMAGEKYHSQEYLNSLSEKHSLFSYEQYSLSGKLIKTFSRVAELRNAGFDPSSVCKVCGGKANTHKSFIWKRIPKVT